MQAREALERRIEEANEAITKLKAESALAKRRDTERLAAKKAPVAQKVQTRELPDMEEVRPKGFTEPTPAEAKPEKEEEEEELLSEIISAGADNGDKEKTMSKQKLIAVDAKDTLDNPWSATIVKFLAAHEDAKVVTLPVEVVGGGKVACYFQVAKSDIRRASRVKVVGSYNGWQYLPFEYLLDLRPDAPEGFTWRHVSLQIPDLAYDLSFVFTDGEKNYDNNGRQDYVLKVKGGPSHEKFIEMLGEEETFNRKKAAADLVARERKQKLREEETNLKVQAEVAEAVEAQYSKARAALKSAQREKKGVWSTNPSPIKAGRPVKLFYVCSRDHLEWANRIDVTAAVDGWTRGRNIGRPMRNTGNGTWETEINIPEDALAFDFVFSEGEKYDNNGGLDYHAPVDPHLSKEDRIQRMVEKKLLELPSEL